MEKFTSIKLDSLQKNTSKKLVLITEEFFALIARHDIIQMVVDFAAQNS